jgi:hypothetical protein
MTKPFDSLYAELEKVLKQGMKGKPGPDKYLHGLRQIRERIGKVHAQAAKILRNEAAEIGYFRDVWPAFHAKYLLYIWLYDLELRRGATPAEDWPAILRGEENRVTTFFQSNGRFWQYYQAGAIDEQFTRAYSRQRIFEPLAMVIDQDGATLASYRACWCLAMHAYGEWLREERALLSAGAVSAADLGYSWGASDADLAEWLFGIQAVGAVKYQGQPADISRLQRWANLALGKTVANIYDRARVLRNRKKEKLAFTNKIAAALQKKWNEAEGKFD